MPIPVQSRLREARPRQFWERPEIGGYPGAQPPPTPYELPEFDIAGMVQQGIAPVERAYGRGIEGIQSRLSKRRLGESGAYVQEELDAFEGYMKKIGAFAPDLPLKTAQVQMEAARLGMTQDQYMRQMALERERLYAPLAVQQQQWAEEQALKETTQAQKYDIERRKLGLTEEQFKARLDWEQEQFGRTLDSEDRRFDRQMELSWRQMDLSEQEVNDKKQMFYDQLKQYESQFDREYSLKETDQMQRYETEQRSLDLTEDEMKNQMDQFNKTLEWEQSQYDTTLSWEKRRFADEMAFRLQELKDNNDISWAQFNENMRQFDDSLRQTATLETARLELQQEQMMLDYELDQGRITIDDYNSQTARLQAENQFKLDWGWTDDSGVSHPGRMQLEETKNKMMEMEIFGYWDEGFAPSDFTGDKYTGEYDEQDNREMTREWEDYVAEHYHKGQLDLAEYQIWLDGLLGMKGVSNEYGTPQTNSQRWSAIAKNEDRVKEIDGLLDPQYAWAYTLSDSDREALRAEKTELTAQNNSWRSEMEGEG